MTTAHRRALAAVLGLALLASACGGGDDEPATDGTGATSQSTTAAGASLDQIERFTVTSANHSTERVTYPQTPPVGGDHAPVWQNCGFYSSPIIPELGVHSMEHGAAWITFRPDLPAEQVDVLRGHARRPYVLVTPWDGALPSPVVASAWGLQLKLESAIDPALSAFIRTFANGPQTPERGAPCNGAFGTPET